MGNKTFRFKVGEFTCWAISDGDDWDRNVLLIDTGEQRVLIDTGVGQDLYPTPALLPERLAAVGSPPDAIDVVMLSHADFDHIGGTVDASGKRAFPNARYLLPQREWDFWATNPERLPVIEGYDEGFREGYTIPQTRLAQLRDIVELIESDTEIVPGIRSSAAPGHTPGYTVISVASGATELLFIGDLIYTPKDIEDPNWYSIFDFDPVQVVTTRQRVLAQTAQAQTLLMASHMPFPGLGYVAHQAPGWRWTPLELSDFQTE